MYILLSNRYLPKPSPKPKITLEKIKVCIEWEKRGTRKVDIDHSKTARVKIVLPPYFLAALPPTS